MDLLEERNEEPGGERAPGQNGYSCYVSIHRGHCNSRICIGQSVHASATSHNPLIELKVVELSEIQSNILSAFDYNYYFGCQQWALPLSKTC